MKKKSCNFLMLQVILCLISQQEKEENNWNVHFEMVQENSFYFIMETLKFPDVMSHLFPPYYFFSKSQEVHGGPAVSFFHWRGSYNQVFSFCISLIDYLLLQMYEKCISGRGLLFIYFFFRHLIVPSILYIMLLVLSIIIRRNPWNLSLWEKWVKLWYKILWLMVLWTQCINKWLQRKLLEWNFVGEPWQFVSSFFLLCFCSHWKTWQVFAFSISMII